MLDHRGAARIAVRRLEGEEFFLEDGIDPLLVLEDRLTLRNELELLLELFFNLLALEPRERLQAHLENGIRLDLRETELLHQTLFRYFLRLALLDGLDDFVDVIECFLQTLENVPPLLSPVAIERDAAGDDDAAVINEDHDEFLEVEEPRLETVCKRDGVVPEAALEIGVLEELVEHLLWVGILLEFDDDTDAFAVGLVADIRNTLDDLVVHKLCHLLDHRGLIHLVRDLGDADLVPSALVLFDFRLPAHDHRPPPGQVCLCNGSDIVHDAPRGEVRPLHVLEEVIHRGLGSVYHMHGGIHHLAEVVRRDVRGHAHGNTHRAYDRHS